MHGGVIVMDVVRRDANPLDGVTGTVGLPREPFLCVSPIGQFTGMPLIRVVLLAPPPALSVAERAVIATVSAASADLQTVAAIGLLRCSPGAEEDVETDAGVRALVPVALSGTCEGAVQGALLAIGVAALVSVGVTAVLMKVRGVEWSAAAAMTRCPGLVIAVWAFMQMGLVVCGARLITGDSPVLGAVGVAAGGALPVVCMLLTWGVVSRRCYRLTQTPKAAAGRSYIVVRLRALLLPSYELDGDAHPVSKAYSACLWSALPVMQPVVMLLVVFVQGPMCSTMLILAGVALMLLGAVCHIWFRPHRTLAANHLQGAAMALNAAVLVVTSKLVSDPVNISAVGANRTIAMIQVALSVCRTAHTVGCLAYMRLYSKTVFQLCDPTYEKMIGPDTDDNTSPLPVAPVFEYISPCSHYDGSNNSRQKMCAVEDLLPVLTPMVITTNPHGFNDNHNNNNTSDGDGEEELIQRSDPTPPPISSDHDDTPLIAPVIKKKQRNKKIIKQEKKKKKNTTTTAESTIISSVINNHRGYVPMERPYTMLWEPSDEEDDLVDLNNNNSDDSSDGDGGNYEYDSSSSNMVTPSTSTPSESNGSNMTKAVGKSRSTQGGGDNNDHFDL